MNKGTLASRTAALATGYNIAVAASILIPMSILAATGYWGREAQLADMRAEADRLSVVLSEHALKSFESFEFILKSIDERFERRTLDDIRGESQKYAAQLSILKNSLPQIAGIGVSDGSGKLVITAPPLTGFGSIADREYWFAQREKDQGTFISKSFVGRASQQETFSFSRRRSTADGSFQGTLHINVEVAYFSDFWRSVMAGASSPVVALVRQDGEVLMRTAKGATPRYSPESQLMRVINSGRTGAYRASSPNDGQERLYSLHQVGGFPIFLGVGLGVPAVWTDQLRLMTAMCVGASLVLLALLHFARKKARDMMMEEARREAAEGALRKQQHIQVLGSLSSTVAHDFSNILQAVQGGLRLIQKDIPSRGASTKVLESIEAATIQGQMLVRQILDFAKRGSASDDVADVRPIDVVRRVYLLMKTALPKEFELSLAIKSTPDIRVSPSKLEAVLSNLVVNARDAMPSGGKIELTLGTRDGFVFIAIRDEGIGMTPEQLHRAGTMFWTTKGDKGTGLGLATARAFVDDAGGDLQIESVAGCGTTVTLSLPRSAALPSKVIPLRHS